MLYNAITEAEAMLINCVRIGFFPIVLLFNKDFSREGLTDLFDKLLLLPTTTVSWREDELRFIYILHENVVF